MAAPSGARSTLDFLAPLPALRPSPLSLSYVPKIHGAVGTNDGSDRDGVATNGAKPKVVAATRKRGRVDPNAGSDLDDDDDDDDARESSGVDSDDGAGGARRSDRDSLPEKTDGEADDGVSDDANDDDSVQGTMALAVASGTRKSRRPRARIARGIDAPTQKSGADVHEDGDDGDDEDVRSAAITPAAVADVALWSELVGNELVIRSVCDNLVWLAHSDAAERRRRRVQAATFAALEAQIAAAVDALGEAKRALPIRVVTSGGDYFPDDGESSSSSSSSSGGDDDDDKSGADTGPGKTAGPTQRNAGQGASKRETAARKRRTDRKKAAAAVAAVAAAETKDGSEDDTEVDDDGRPIQTRAERRYEQAERRVSKRKAQLEKARTEEAAYREQLAQSAACRKVMLLHGSPGVGKSTGVKLIARRTRRRVRTFNMSVLRNRDDVLTQIRPLLFRDIHPATRRIGLALNRLQNGESGGGGGGGDDDANSEALLPLSDAAHGLGYYWPPVFRKDATGADADAHDRATEALAQQLTTRDRRVRRRYDRDQRRRDERRRRGDPESQLDDADAKTDGALPPPSPPPGPPEPAFADMSDPVLIVLEEMEGMSPHGMAELALLFDEMARTPREFQPILCLCNDVTKLGRARLLERCRPFRFEKINRDGLRAIAHRRGCTTVNTPQLSVIVDWVDGDARRLLNAICLVPSYRSSTAAAEAATFSSPPVGTSARGSSAQGVSTALIDLAPLKTRSRATPAETVGALFRQAERWIAAKTTMVDGRTGRYVATGGLERAPLDVDSALDACRGSEARAVVTLIGERYSAGMTVGDIDLAVDASRALVFGDILGGVAHFGGSASRTTGTQPLAALNSVWATVNTAYRRPLSASSSGSSSSSSSSSSQTRQPATPLSLAPSRPEKTNWRYALTGDSYRHTRAVRDKIDRLLALPCALPLTRDAVVTLLLPFCGESRMTESEAFGGAYHYDAVANLA